MSKRRVAQKGPAPQAVHIIPLPLEAEVKPDRAAHDLRPHRDAVGVGLGDKVEQKLPVAVLALTLCERQAHWPPPPFCDAA